MPKNTGEPPQCETCDIRFRNGHITRNTDPKKWRWSIGAAGWPKDYAFDIAEFQIVKTDADSA